MSDDEYDFVTMQPPRDDREFLRRSGNLGNAAEAMGTDAETLRGILSGLNQYGTGIPDTATRLPETYVGPSAGYRQDVAERKRLSRDKQIARGEQQAQARQYRADVFPGRGKGMSPMMAMAKGMPEGADRNAMMEMMMGGPEHQASMEAIRQRGESATAENELTRQYYAQQLRGQGNEAGAQALGAPPLPPEIEPTTGRPMTLPQQRQFETIQTMSDPEAAKREARKLGTSLGLTGPELEDFVMKTRPRGMGSRIGEWLFPGGFMPSLTGHTWD